MITKKFIMFMALNFALFSLSFFFFTQAATVDELTLSRPQCKMPTQKRPLLPANSPYESAKSILVDASGDGWCDYILQIPYPINSKMSSYSLNEIMLLGSSSGWQAPFHGKKIHEVAEPFGPLNNDTWIIHRVDFVNARFLYVRTGAPYLFGVYAGGEEPKLERSDGCEEYGPVYRWDEVVGGFRKVISVERELVLNFYYSKLDKPCTKNK
jgi:hypothetical protein